MDPFSIRLRKQRERSSLHARQLNKNAMTMLRRQLNALEKNEQQNARTLRRTKQAILEEIEASKDIEHEGLERRQNNPPHLCPRTLPSLATDDPPPREVTVVPVQHLVPENDGFYQHKAGSGNVQFALKGSANHSQVLSASERGRSAMRVRHLNGNTKREDTCGDLSCRFRALSPLSPCRYFPCRRPQSYHRLGVSEVVVPSDPIPLGGGSEGGGDEPMLSPRSQVSSGSLQSNSTHFLSDTQGSVQSSGKETNRSVSASKSRLGEGHTSPRTTIQERLRGLKQVGRQMRDRNEANRPRDWAINYGDPVNKRLLRKPVVAVSEVVL